MLVIKRNKVLIHATARMNLEDMLSERFKTQKATYYTIPFTGVVQKRQIYRDRKWISDCQGLGQEGKCGVIIGTGFLFAVIKMF